MSVRTWSRVLPYLIAAGLAFWFTAANADTWVWVDLILFELRLSLPLLVFLSILLGMMIVFVAGIRSDLRTRRMLERYRMAVDLAPPKDARAEPRARALDEPRRSHGPREPREAPVAEGSHADEPPPRDEAASRDEPGLWGTPE